MRDYIIKRFLMTIPVIIGVLFFVFFSLYLTPGDPVEMLIPPDMPSGASEEFAEELRARLGLDRPLHLQFIHYIQRVVLLDFGRSIRTNRRIIDDLKLRYPATAELALSSMFIAVVIGSLAGITAATKQHTLFDHTTMSLSYAGVSIPHFWLGLMLMLFFGLRLGWLPPSGRGETFLTLDAMRRLILPSFTLGLPIAAIIARLVRSTLLDILKEDYIRTARAKGLSERIVTYNHALRNALIPVVTIMGLQFGALLGGTVVIETVFSWPGMGRYLITAISGRDFPAVQGGVLCISITFVFINLFVDIAYGFLDPRIRYD